MDTPVPAPTPPDRRLRFAEWALLYSVPFGVSLLVSLLALVSGYQLRISGGDGLMDASSGPRLVATLAGMGIREVAALGLLWCVLKRRGVRPAEYLGLSFVWTDVPVGIFIAAVSYTAYYSLLVGFRWAAPYAASAFTQHNMSSFRSSAAFVPAAALAFALVNPFGEEIIARAFTQREMEDLTGHGPRVGALISVLLQAAYHLYQGVVYAVGVGASFAVYAAYFARRRRVAPIIVAHLITDVAAVLITAARYRH